MPMPLSTDPNQRQPFGNDVSQPIITDSEVLIRQAFVTDVRRGYEALFRRYYQSLCSQAARFVYSREIAEDIVSEVFFNFWKNQAHTHITISFRAYLFAAVRNRASNYLQEELQRRGRMESLPDNSDFSLPDDDPHQMLQLSELYNRINEEVRSLSPQCQRVFVLSRFEGRKHREIAEELDISPKTVEVHILKALAHLRKALLTGLFFLLTFGQPG